MVDTYGTAIFLPTRSAGLLMPLPLRTTSASDSPITPVTRKVWIGRPRLAAAASGLEPILPIGTSPEATAAITSAPLSNLRQLIFLPVAFS
ncbi:hypothetical protein D3C78_1515090 [compost metagenome]